MAPPMITDNPYRDLRDARLPAEEFVRAALRQLEADHRKLALSALAEWEVLRRVDSKLVAALASMRRPSWGAHIQLLRALVDAACRMTLEKGDGARENLELLVPILGSCVELYTKPVEDEVVSAIEPLAEFTRVSLAEDASLGEVLELPACLAFRQAHEAPTDVRWWSFAANALFHLVEIVADQNPVRARLADALLPKPWFLCEGEDVWCFHGLTKRQKVRYVSDDHEIRREDALGDVSRSFQVLLGRDEMPGDLRKFLGVMERRELFGVILGDFLIGPPVGTGPTGTVHEGRQISTGIRVAVKILHEGLPPSWTERFHDAAEALQSTSHDNLLRVVGHGLDEQWVEPSAPVVGDWLAEFSKGSARRCFVALEWRPHDTMEALFAAGSLPDQATLMRWFRISAEALAVLHRLDHVHLGIHPGNIGLDGNGHLLLMEVGVAARPVDDAAPCVRTAYAAPEQLQQEADEPAPVTAAADVYALCATFYELFTHRRLFDHDRLDEYQVGNFKLIGMTPPAPSSHDDAIPTALDVVLLKGLAPTPDERYATADELAAAIGDMTRSTGISKTGRIEGEMEADA